jgi:single-strand DNA-binding protein
MVNHTIIQGRLVDAPACGQTNGGTDYANFRIAWSEKYKDKETKLFLECKAFGGTAKFISQYMNNKGQELAVEGKLNTEEWEKDGQKRSKVVLVVSSVHFCGKKQDGGVQPNMTPVEMPDGELPF